MDKRLYISDLDGTLLNSKKEVPKKAAQQLNQFIQDNQIHFSVATARTPATVENILKDIHIKEPIVAMNGVALYDLRAHRYIDIMSITKEKAQAVLTVCQDVIDKGFIYTIKDDKLLVYYNDLSSTERLMYFQERQHLKYKKFVKGKPLDTDEIIYFMFLDKEETIKAIYNKIKDIKGIGKILYQDIYTKEGWILEIYSEKATKANGIKRLKALGGYDEVVAFGDNYNDLTMFEVADRAYAVSNAVPDVKECATAIIGSCEAGSVAQFIAEEIKQEREKS